MKQYKVNIIILNFQGEKLLSKYLPSIVDAAKKSVHRCKVTVLDNCSTDAGVEYARMNFPDVELIRARENKVLCSYNEVVQAVDDDIVILLNNDIGAENDFIDPLVEVFEAHEDAFFVATFRDRSLPKLRRGILSACFDYSGYAEQIHEFGYTLNTGMGAFHRQRFVELGGYDEIYLPGRYEDLDLCYRGWKRGWKGYYQPKSILRHEGGTSFNKYFTEKENERLVLRNSILFMMKNVTDWQISFEFFIWLPVMLLGFAMTGSWHKAAGIGDVLPLISRTLRVRRQLRTSFIKKDADILKFFKANKIAIDQNAS